MSRRWKLGLVVVVAGALGWPWYRARQVEAFRQHLRAADAGTKEAAVSIGGRFYRSGELQAATARTLVGPDADRRETVEPPFDDPVAAIVDFRDRLAERGIELWVVPGPLRTWVAPHQVLDGGSSIAAWTHAGIYADPYDGFLDALRAEGVHTVDLLPALRRRALVAPSDFIHRTDPHWTGPGVVLASKRLARELQGHSWMPDEPPFETEVSWEQVERTASAGGITLPDEPNETIWLRKVQLAEEDEEGKRRVPVVDPRAPVLVMGDSHVDWYHKKEADFGRQLIHEAGVAVDTLPLIGGGATRSREELARRVMADPEYLSSTKVVIWVFWMEDVWSRPWGLVPLERIPVSRLERRAGRARVDLDRHLVVDGRGEASLDYRWRTPDPGGESRVAWIRKPELAGLTIHGPVPRGSSLVMEVIARGEAREIEWSVNRRRRPRFVAEQGSTRIRVPLPRSSKATTNLRIGLRDKPRQTDVFGIRNLTLVTTSMVWSERFDPDDAERFARPHKELERTFATTGKRYGTELQLEEVRGDLVVRARFRAVRGEHAVTLTVNGHVALDAKRVGRGWVEHVISVPEAWLKPGINAFVWTVPRGERVLAWDVFEIDAVPRP